MMIDTLILSMVFIKRVYHGDEFNKSFDEYKEKIKKLNDCLFSIKNLSNHYFHEKEPLKNKYYKAIT